MSSPSALDIEKFLAHEDFLRALAHRLVADPGIADDIVQETWVAALSSPPDGQVPAKGWLTTVAKNAARMVQRSGARRTQREQRAARPVTLPSTTELLERERARRGVAAAVLRLGEPYRSTIVLRYYEGLPPREVAARLGVPVETVRTRTRRAIQRMREDLDTSHNDRRAWLALVAPLAAPGTHTPHVAGGLLAVTTSVRLALVGLILLIAAGGAAFLLLGKTEGEQDTRAAMTSAETEGGPPVLAGRSGKADAGAEDEAPSTARPELDVFRKQRPRGMLRGIVLSGKTHEPVADTPVFVELERGTVPDGMRVTSFPQEGDGTRTDAKGRFVFHELPYGAYRVRIRYYEGGYAEELAVASANPPWIRLYPLPDRPELRSFTVRVVDANKRPIANARVACVCGAESEPLVLTSDAEGLARFEDLPLIEKTVQGWITASSAEGMGRVPFTLDTRFARPQRKHKEIVLGAAGVLAGTVSAAGKAIPDAQVEALSLVGGRGTWANFQAHRTVTLQDGAFRFEELPPGRYTLLVKTKASLRMDLSISDRSGVPNWVPMTATVEAGKTTHVDIPLVPAATVRGRVQTAAGSPVADARVEIQLPQGPRDYEERTTRGGVHLWRLDSRWPDERRFALNFRVVQTDSRGRYEVGGLLPGKYRVRVIAGEDLTFDKRESVTLTDGQTTELEHTLEPAGTLEFVARPFESLGIRRRGSTEMFVSMITPRSALAAITIPGLPAGAWDVVLLHSESSVTPVEIARFDIRAGELTYLDVSRVGNAELRIRLLDRGRPVVGALLTESLHGRSLIETDEEGYATWQLAVFARTGARTARIELPTPHAADLFAKIPIGRTDVALSVPTGALSVLVRDASGRTVPQAEARLWATAVDEEKELAVVSAGENRRTTDAAGSAHWRHVSPGSYRITVRLPESGMQISATAVLGDGHERIEMQAGEPGVIRLRVVGEDGQPYSGALVGATVLPSAVEGKGWEHATSLTKGGWRTDSEGRFTIRGIPAGKVRVYAWVMQDDAPIATHNAESVVPLTAGAEAEIELALRKIR